MSSTPSHDPEKGSLSDDPDLAFAPINTSVRTETNPYAVSQIASRASYRSSRANSLVPTRSNNGYGVSDLSPEPSSDGEEGGSSDVQTAPSKDAFEVGWDNGDDDPLCPRHMGTLRKWLIVFLVSFGSFCVTCTSSIYVSTYVQMEAEFGESRLMSTAGLSLFVLGIGLGPAVLSPLSEFYGRKPIYVTSFLMFIIWNIPEAVAQNISTILAGRMFAGLAGSSFLSVSGGTVGDIFNQDQLAAPMMLFSLAPFVGPSIGPLIGGFINTYADWRWTYYVLLIWSGCLGLAIAVLVPETYHPVLLRNKARALRESTGDDRYRAPIEKTSKSVLNTIMRSLLRPFQLLIFESMVLCLCIYSAILLGILYLFFGCLPLVFKNNHGFSLWQNGLAFMGIFVGMVLSALTDPLWRRIRLQLITKKEAESGGEGTNSEPEFRLPPAILGGVLVPIGLFWFAWTLMPGIHWIVPIIGSGVFGAGTLLVFTGIFTFLVDAYPHYAASALAANALVRCTFAAIFPLFGEKMFDRLGYSWATSLLAFLTVAMMPFPYVFFRYGKQIRRHSRFAAGP